MKYKTISVPELGMIAGTRVALGFGLGLLMASRMKFTHRRAVGWTLFGVGALTTIPLAADVLLHHESNGSVKRHAPRHHRIHAR